MRLKLLNYIRVFIFLLLVCSIVFTIILYKKNKKLNYELSTAVSNEKAFIQEINNLKDNNRVYQFNINQLEYINDSIIKKMNAIKEQLHIKNKNIKQMQYMLSEVQKKDTIIFRDTIFKDKVINIDTILNNKWYNLQLKLKYPNIVSVYPRFISEKYVILSYKKETVNPPKKCLIARWFQKKHKVITADIVEKNPYITNLKQKFIKIIK